MDRTLYRPRDIIAFINECFEAAVGQTKIGSKVISKSEGAYSRKRLEALVEEWQSIHPELRVLLGFLVDRGERISYNEITVRETIEDLIINLSATNYSFKDGLMIEVERYYTTENWSNIGEIVRNTFSVLYKVGAINLKTARGQTYLRSFIDDPVIPPDQITKDAEGRVHPMLWRALGVTPNL